MLICMVAFSQNGRVFAKNIIKKPYKNLFECHKYRILSIKKTGDATKMQTHIVLL